MKFNVEKCKEIHVGNNVHASYKMDDVDLPSTAREKDLGVYISGDLKPSHHCTEIVKTANKIVGLIGRTFEHISENIILTSYNCLV